MGNTLSHCCGSESKPAKQKQKSKQFGTGNHSVRATKVNSHMGLFLAETPENVNVVCTCFCRPDIARQMQSEDSYTISKGRLNLGGRLKQMAVLRGKREGRNP